MTHDFFLLSGKNSAVSIAHLEILERALGELGMMSDGAPSWIAAHKMARLPVNDAPDMERMKRLREMFSEDQIDIFCLPSKREKIRLFLADMDSTIVTSETLDELAAKAGIKDRIAAITARAMNGELDFKAALRERVALLKGLPISAMEEALEETVLCDGAAELVTALKADGATCVLVSGGFTFFTDAIARRAGFDRNHGNTLNHDGSALDGTVGDDILDKDAKLRFLKDYAGTVGCDLSETAAIGDGANDLPMLTAAGIGIGYRPKPVVAETIPNVLNYADLDDLVPIFANR